VATKSSQSARSVPQIESDLAATRSRLAHSIETLIDQVHPKRVKQRQLARLRHLVSVQVNRARSEIYDAQGQLRTERLTVVGGAVAGLVAFVLIVRKIASRGRKRSVPKRK
jgi:hypothetical protein